MTARTPAKRILGVLGGMGPAATAEFLRLLATGSPAQNDQEHPRLLMLSDPDIPERSAAVLNRDRTTAGHILEDLCTLARWGADLLAVPCNTAHVFIDEIQAQVPVPLVHIVDACLYASIRQSPEGSWLTASNGTLASGLYQERARELGHQLLTPVPAVQHRIHEVSVLVKANRLPEAALHFAEVAGTLWEEKSLPLLGACTELPLAYSAAGLPPTLMISSLEALARACVDELYSTTVLHPHKRRVDD